MSSIELLCALVAAVGLALVLTELPWFRRTHLAGRLRPYAPPTTAGSARTTASDRAPWRAVLLPLADQVGGRVAGLLGLHDDLALRLTRAGMTIDAAAFRMRQIVHLVLGLGAGALTALVLSPPPLLGAVLVLGSPIVWVLIDEQLVSWRAAERNRRLGLELPVIAEQLGILLSGGWSLPSAIRRIGDRGRGVAAEDLRTVSRRIRQGRSETEALVQWSDRRGTTTGSGDSSPCFRCIGRRAISAPSSPPRRGRSTLRAIASSSRPSSAAPSSSGFP